MMRLSGSGFFGVMSFRLDGKRIGFATPRERAVDPFVAVVAGRGRTPYTFVGEA